MNWKDTVMEPNAVNIMPYLQDFITCVKAKDKEATEITLGKMVRDIAEAQAEITGPIAEKAGIKKESEAIIRCIKDAKRVHPNWGIDDVIKLLHFREETKIAVSNGKPF